MSKRESEAKEVLSGLRFIQIGRTLHVISASLLTEFRAKAEKAIRRGVLVEENGIRTWETTEMILRQIAEDADPSSRFIWDKSGNRVKHNRVRHTVILKTGEHTTEMVGPAMCAPCVGPGPAHGRSGRH